MKPLAYFIYYTIKALTFLPYHLSGFSLAKKLAPGLMYTEIFLYFGVAPTIMGIMSAAILVGNYYEAIPLYYLILGCVYIAILSAVGSLAIAITIRWAFKVVGQNNGQQTKP